MTFHILQNTVVIYLSSFPQVNLNFYFDGLSWRSFPFSLYLMAVWHVKSNMVRQCEKLVKWTLRTALERRFMCSCPLFIEKADAENTVSVSELSSNQNYDTLSHRDIESMQHALTGCFRIYFILSKNAQRLSASPIYSCQIKLFILWY